MYHTVITFGLIRSYFVFYLGASLRQLDLDNFTVTEILRLHFLGSGGEGSSSDAKFRWQQRGGYVSSDDAGLEFRREQPDVLQALACGNVFDMSPGNSIFSRSVSPERSDLSSHYGVRMSVCMYVCLLGCNFFGKGKNFWQQIWLDTCSDPKKFFFISSSH